MAKHEFGIMQTVPQKGKRYDYYEPHKYNCIVVDEYLENIIVNLKDIDFYWHTLDISGKGLAYYGVTLIPPTSMSEFISIIEDISELYELKKLLKKAYSERKGMIHFGL